MAFASAEEAALAGDRTSAETKVLTSVQSGPHAAVLITSPGWPQPDLVFCYQDQTGWTEGSSTTGATVWSHAEDDPPGVGQLVCWHEAEPGSQRVRVLFRGRTIERPVEDGYVIWIADSIAEEHVDDEAQFTWLP